MLFVVYFLRASQTLAELVTARVAVVIRQKTKRRPTSERIIINCLRLSSHSKNKPKYKDKLHHRTDHKGPEGVNIIALPFL